MASQKEITICFGKISPDHEFFNYVHDKNDIDLDKVLTVSGHKGENLLFGAIFECYGDCIHLREAGGHFYRHCDYLMYLAVTLAKNENKPRISFNTKRRAVKRFGLLHGFKECNINKEYFYKEI